MEINKDRPPVVVKDSIADASFQQFYSPLEYSVVATLNLNGIMFQMHWQPIKVRWH